MLYFTLSSGYNRYGCWGITDDYTKPDRNYKMQAIRDIIGPISGIQETAVNDIGFDLYPNPATKDLTCELILQKEDNVSIFLYNQLGQRVQTLLDHKLLTAGMHAFHFSVPVTASGLLYTVMMSGKSIVTNTIVFAK